MSDYPELDYQLKLHRAEQSLRYAKTTEQMKKAVVAMKYGSKQLANLAVAIAELQADIKAASDKAALVQTYQVKIVKLAKELDMSYEEVIQVLNSK